MDLALTIGIGIGFASVTGMRAFLSLVLVLLLYASFTLFGNPPYLILQISAWLNLVVVVVLLVLTVLEGVLDKFAALEHPLNRAMVPVRAAAGAVAFGIVMVVQDPFVMRGPMSTWHHMRLPEALPTLMPWLIVGAVIAGVVAVLKAILRPSETASAGVSTTTMSFFEDLAALAGGILPFLGSLLVAVLLLFYYRVKRRRGRRFGGLRILGD